jgi:hypothetical protein
LSVPIYDFAEANEELAIVLLEQYFPCCGKIICGGCVHSLRESGNDDKCPFCNSEGGKTDEECVEDLMKRVEADDAASICMLAAVKDVFNRIKQRQWNYTLGQQSLVVVMRIINLVLSIIKGGI